MSDFESFITQQLNEYGFIDSALTKVGNKISPSRLGHKAMAALGSETSSGELDLRSEISSIYTSFKKFCGQQRINMASDLRAEDYVDFLIHQCQFHIDDPVQFIYGQPKEESVEQQYDAIKGQFESGSHGDAGPLIALAQQNNPTARYCLWELKRLYKSASSQLAPVSSLCGKVLQKTPLTQMIERTAKIRLKRKTSGGAAGGAAKKGAPAQPQVSMNAQGVPQFNVPQGVCQACNVNMSEGWSQPAFGPEGVFAKGGLTNIAQVARGLAQDAVANKSEYTAEQVKRFSAMDESQSTNLARMLLEFFRPSKMHAFLDPIFKKFNPAKTDEDGHPVDSTDAVQGLQHSIFSILGEMNAGSYKAEDVHLKLKQLFHAKMGQIIVALLICLDDAYTGSLKSAGGAGPGGAD